MADDAPGEQTPEIYEAGPPQWLLKTSRASELGHHGYFPPRSGQDEDQLSDANVKNGLISKPTIPAESFTSKVSVIKALKEGDYVSELEDFMNQIFERRSEDLPDIPASSFRMPSRVTLNDAKREAYFADLANPDVPLYKLGKSVPHGAKGHELLDLLHSNNVAIPRAVWFLRVFGSNETVGLRNKPNYNPMQYSLDWALIMTSYLKKQLSEIALPSAPRIGLNIKQTFKGIFSETESRDRWLSRFQYSLELLRTFYSEGMVDHGTFLSWLVQQMSTANLAQAAFVARITEEYMDGLVTCRALTRPLVGSCLTKLQEISSSNAKETLAYLEERLINIVRRLFLDAPDSFVSPKMWLTHAETLRKILTENVLDTAGTEAHVKKKIHTVRQSMFAKFVDVQRRNRALLLRNLPRQAGIHLRSAVADVQLLNSISSTTDLRSVPFFDGCTDGNSSIFTQKLDVLLSWAITPLQYGEHRPYAATTLLQLWRDKAEEQATRRDTASPDEALQDQLFDWLDTSDVAADAQNARSVSQLYGELVDKGLFSYGKYIERVIARGEPGLSFAEEEGSLHRQFLRTIPLHRTTLALINQRRVTLYGVRAREIPEDGIEKQIRNELRSAFPELFGGSGAPKFKSIPDLKSGMKTLMSASRYEQVRCISGWLLPILRKTWSNVFNVPEDGTSNVLGTYCVLIQVMELLKCFWTVLNCSLDLLSIATSPEIVVAVTETLKRHTSIWASMDVSNTIAQSLYASHQKWKARGVYSRTIPPLLLQIDSGRYLDDTTRQQVIADMAHYAQALRPFDDAPEPVPPVLPEILLMAQDPNPDAPSILANALWYKYRSSLNWVWTVWDNTIASLRQIPSMMTDSFDRRACALRYANFLLHVDEHVVGGLDDHAYSWFSGSGINEISALTAESWDVVSVVLEFLCIHGAVSTTTLLKGVIYPGWQYGVKASSGAHFQSISTFVEAASNLCIRLLIVCEETDDGISSADLLETQKLCTRRKGVYSEPDFSILANNLPTLVYLENSEFADEHIRHYAGYLRKQICTSSEFRLGTYRNLDAVRSAFEKSLDSDITEKLYQSLMSALRLALGDSESDVIPSHANVAGAMSFLSPWKLAASTVTIQFVLKQMESGIKRESSMSASQAELDKFIKRLFLYSMTSEEADFIAEMAKGTGIVIASKFLNHGLRRITEILQEVSNCDKHQLSSMIKSAGEFVKLLSSIMDPFRGGQAAIPSLDLDVQDRLTRVLHSKLQMLEDSLKEISSGEYTRETIITESIVFLSRLLQFELGFVNKWELAQRELLQKLLLLEYRLATSYGECIHIHSSVFQCLLDTVYFIFDELPLETKSTSIDLFQNCVPFDYKNIPITIPSSTCTALKSVLHYIPQDHLVSGLVYASVDTSGEVRLGQQVQNRPWEWIENIGDPPLIDAKDQSKDEEERGRTKLNHTVRNNASVSLGLFAAQITGEGIRTGAGEDDQNQILFEDAYLSESIFERDWRESRILSQEESANVKAREEDLRGPSSAGSRRSYNRHSPGLSACTHSTASSRKQSPSAGKAPASGAKEVIDVDSFVLPAKSLKRPISATGPDDEDDVVMIQGPSEVTRPPAKKSKGKAASKKTK